MNYRFLSSIDYLHGTSPKMIDYDKLLIVI